MLIVDTAGRLHVDAEMMAEVRELDRALKAHQRLFIVDSMAGQDAVNQARAFNEALDLTGVILTKADGDARGGAALSVRQVTGKPILYVGVGEKVDALELFHPERVASRILGMGDVLSLVEQVQRDVDRNQAEKLAKKLAKGKGFDFEDLRDQMQQLEKMGGIGALMDKLPGKISQAAAKAPGQFEAKHVTPADRHDQLDDAGRASPARHHRRFAQAPHRQRLGRPGPGRQPPAQAVPADAEGHEAVLEGRGAGPDAQPRRPVAARFRPLAVAGLFQ